MDQRKFKVDKDSPLLKKECVSHQAARPDIGLAMAFFTIRVRTPTKQDWEKLVQMMKFLINTRNDCLNLQVDGSKNLYWRVNASFAIHGDRKSHTGGHFG
jgi:hypothetical protein